MEDRALQTSDLDESARRKRQAWAEKSGTETYVHEMGAYALRRDAEVVRAMLGHGPGLLLDVPCGTGRYLELERDLGFDVVAADYSPTMLSTALSVSPVNFLRADIFRPPFRQCVFDVVLISRLLFHYAHPEKILSGIVPALKPGGRLVFDVLNTFSTRWVASQILRLARHDSARALYFENPQVFPTKLAELGLEVIERKSAYLLPTRAYRYLPCPLIKGLEAFETACPDRLRVVSFWHARRKCS